MRNSAFKASLENVGSSDCPPLDEQIREFIAAFPVYLSSLQRVFSVCRDESRDRDVYAHSSDRIAFSARVPLTWSDFNSDIKFDSKLRSREVNSRGTRTKWKFNRNDIYVNSNLVRLGVSSRENV